VASGIVESSSQGNEGQQQQQQQQGSGNLSRSKLVQRLLDAGPNLPAFVTDLLTTQATVVAGTEAAGFLVERQDQQFGLRPIAHIRPDDSTPEIRAAALQAFGELIQPFVAQNRDGAREIPGSGEVEPQFCLVTLLRSEGEVVAASAVITRCRDIERAQQRLTSMQLVAGYFDLFTLKRSSEQSIAIAQSHQHVLQLATSVATAEGFTSAGMNLCNEMATRTNASRVSLGWVKGERVRIKALSNTEEFDKRQELIVELERVMEECLDQEEVVQFEPGGTTSQNVTREAQALSRSQGGNTVLSIPLRRQSEVIGVLTLEFPPGAQLGPQAAMGLSVAADLLAPQLYDRYQNDRWLITKTGISIRESAKLVIGPKHMLAQLIVVAVIGALAFLVLYKPMYRVVAPFSFAANTRREVCAPAESFIKEVYVHPGDKVEAGKTVLFELDTTELRKQWAKALGDANTAAKAKIKYMGERLPNGQLAAKLAEANMEAEKEKVALAEAALYKFRIDRAVVKAEISGEVLEGELRDKIGSQVKLGDKLMVIGEPGGLRGELRVAERDIQDIKFAAEKKRGGTLAVSSLPAEKYPFKIVRVFPTTEAKEGANFYKVWVEMEKTNPHWLPGEEGEARVDIRNEPLIWVWTHRLTDFMRLKLWSWGMI
jgi:biotin carboxyl carrier protein